MEEVNKIDPTKESAETSKRRDFLTWLLSGAIFVSLFTVAWGLFKFVYPPRSVSGSTAQAQLVGRVEEIHKGG